SSAIGKGAVAGGRAAWAVDAGAGPAGAAPAGVASAMACLGYCVYRQYFSPEARRPQCGLWIQGMSPPIWHAAPSSLPDTEPAEDHPEQVVGREFPGNLAERLLREAQLLREELQAVALAPAELRGLVEMAGCAAQRIEVTLARDELGLARALPAGELEQAAAQLVDALAGERRQPHAALASFAAARGGQAGQVDLVPDVHHRHMRAGAGEHLGGERRIGRRLGTGLRESQQQDDVGAADLVPGSRDADALHLVGG